MDKAYVIKRFEDVEPVACPCGLSRRAITAEDNDLLSVHRVEIREEAQKHYHKKCTEYYIILSGKGEIELDDERFEIGPGDVVMIPPLTAHVARGEFEIINIVSPPFETADEYLAGAP